MNVAAGAAPGAGKDELAPAWVEWSLLAVLIAVFVSRGLLVAWERLNTDFPNHYLAAKLFWTGHPMERVYEWIWFQRQKDHEGLDQGLVGFIPLTPFSPLAVLPLIGFPALTAKRIWLVGNLVLLGAIVVLMRRLSTMPVRRIALLVFLAIVPLRTNFHFGQQYLLLLALIALAAWSYAEGRHALAGVLLAFAAALKVYPALFVLFFLRKRRWRALAGLLLTSLALAAAGTALFGIETMRQYGVEIAPRVWRAELNDPYTVNLNSLTFLLRRLFLFEPELNPQPLLHAPVLYSLLQPISSALLLVPGLALLAPGRGDRRGELLDFAAYQVLLFVIASGFATYQLCTLILPLVLVVDHLLGEGRLGRARLAVVLYAVTCLPLSAFVPASPGGWKIFLGFPRIYALLGLWLLVLTILWRLRPWPTVALRQRALLGLAFGGLVALGAASSWRHLDGQFESYASRLVPSRSLVTTPAVAGDETYFSELYLEGYRLERTGRPLAAGARRGTDLFHPALPPSGPEGWVEVASTTSRIVRFPRGSTQLSVGELAIEVEGAEQPAISVDGRWLAFVREERGRGRLWIKDREARPPNERELLGHPHDVRQLAFSPGDGLYVSSFFEGKARLFRLDPPWERPVPIDTAGAPAGYPAVSPDGRWLAHARKRAGNWQLWILPLEGGEARRLTKADCNALWPSWRADSKTVVYATDCGRGLGWTALSTLTAVP